VIEAALIERKRGFQGPYDFGSAGVTHKASDIFESEIHARENAGYRGAHILSHEARDGAAKNNPESFRIHIPAHNIQGVGPKMFTEILKLNLAAVPGTQYHRGRAIAEQADGNDVCLRQLIEAKGGCAEFDSDEKHVGSRSRLCEARRDGKARHATRASQTENRYSRNVRPESELLRHASFQTRRRNTRGADGDDGIDFVGCKVGPLQCFPCHIHKQRLAAFEERLRPIGPPARFAIPFDRLDAVARDDAAVLKNFRKTLEFRITLSEQLPCHERNRTLPEYMRRNRGRQGNETSRRFHASPVTDMIERPSTRAAICETMRQNPGEFQRPME
jgi:hypothetical protein